MYIKDSASDVLAMDRSSQVLNVANAEHW